MGFDSIHRSKAVTEFLSSTPGMLSENFPPYAPELNPVDKIWGYIKFGRLANYAPFSLIQLRSKVREELTVLKSRGHILRGFIESCGLSVR